MAFDFGGLFGGGLSGAAAGSAFGPIGTIAGGLLGGLGGGLSGGGGPGGIAAYEPTPLQEELLGYGRKQVKATPARKEALKEQYKNLKTRQNRGAAEAFLESYRDRFSNPAFIEKRLAKSYGKDIDFTGKGFQDIAQSVYGQQGLGYTGEEYGDFASRAKGLGIRSPQAFGDMLRQGMIASGKVMTPQQESLSYMFGTPERDPSGRLTNRYPSIEKYTPTALPQAITYQYGA